MSTTAPQSSGQSSRRALMRRGAAVSAVAGASLAVPGRAEAAAPKPGHWKGAPLLSSSSRHLVGRFSYGVTPALTRRVRAMGVDAWFEQQLRPTTVADPVADTLTGWWPSLTRTPQDLWQRQTTGVEGGWEVMSSYQRWLLVRRTTTNRQLHEVMSEFWMNHLNVPVHHDATFTYRFAYDRVVRAHALGRFEDLLQAAITHPAMGLFLDNAVSTRARPNENLGRELLELHTVGRGAYTEEDVKASARLLTGYRVDMWRTWVAEYKPEDHATGPVRVMDFTHPNASPDGREATQAYLSYLARHPRTAERIARKLAVKFVGDAPSERLVRQLAAVYLASGTDIKPVLRTLIRTPEFKAAAGAKVRDPGEDLVATYRALGATLRRPPPGDNSHAATAMLWQAASIGAVPFEWPRPDGQPIDNSSWSSPARLLASMDVHWSMSGGWWPREGIVYRTPRQWLPRSTVRFDVLVDHLSQQLLGRRSTTTLLQACCTATGCRPGERITKDSNLVKWNFHRLLGTLLDSPSHLTR